MIVKKNLIETWHRIVESQHYGKDTANQKIKCKKCNHKKAAHNGKGEYEYCRICLRLLDYKSGHICDRIKSECV